MSNANPLPERLEAQEANAQLAGWGYVVDVTDASWHALFPSGDVARAVAHRYNVQPSQEQALEAVGKRLASTPWDAKPARTNALREITAWVRAALQPRKD